MDEMLFVVVQLIGGYAREDTHNASVVGVYRNKEKADLVAAASGFGAKVFPVVSEEVPAGILQNAHELFPARAKTIFGERHEPT